MIINLREWYPDYYKADVYIDVPDEIVAAMKEYDRQDAAYQRRTYYNKAHYSLDRGDGIESAVLFPPQTPEEICERRTRIDFLYQTIASLPIKQPSRNSGYVHLHRPKVHPCEEADTPYAQRADPVHRSPSG